MNNFDPDVKFLDKRIIDSMRNTCEMAYQFHLERNRKRYKKMMAERNEKIADNQDRLRALLRGEM